MVAINDDIAPATKRHPTTSAILGAVFGLAMQSTRAVMVAPIETMPESDSILYRIRLLAMGVQKLSTVAGFRKIADRLSKDAAGRLMPNPELRAITGMLVVTFAVSKTGKSTKST